MSWRWATMVGGAMAATMTAGAVTAGEVPKSAQKYFGQYCVRCHGDKKQEKDFRIDELTAIDASTAPQWRKVLEKLSLSEMPPADELQPTLAETEPVTDWIANELEKLNRRSGR